MAVQLEHPLTMSKPIDESFATITDLEQVVLGPHAPSGFESILDPAK